MYIHREIEAGLLRQARLFPVLTVLGPRQSGKTTVVRKLFAEYRYVNLELPDLRQLAQEDPRSFLQQNPPPVIFDEVQRVPQLLSYLQAAVDQDTTIKGSYVLTGSHQAELHSAIAQSLAGRTAIATLLPLSLTEIATTGASLDRDDCLFRGCMPQLYQQDIPPVDVYRNYFRTYVERDMRQIANIRNLSSFETFIRLLAGRVGCVLNMSEIANATGVSVPTIKEWLSILEASYIIFRLPPYFHNYGKRLIKSPKLYFIEPGLAAWLLGIRSPDQVTSGPFLGGLFENLVVMEALKTRHNQLEDPNLFFYRDNNGLEVDLLIDSLQTLIPVEIKAARTFNHDFTRNIRRVQKLDSRISSGAVAYAGEAESSIHGTRVLNFVRTQNLLIPPNPAL